MKKITKLIALLLALLLLAGCGANSVPMPTPAPAPTPDPNHVRTPRPGSEAAEPVLAEEISYDWSDRRVCDFGEISYERPDLDEVLGSIQTAEDVIRAGGDFDDICIALDECMMNYDLYATMDNLSYILMCLDMTDEYYGDENEWMEEHLSDVEDAMDGLYYACAASDFAGEIEEIYFWEGLLDDYEDEENSRFNEKTVELMKQETAILAEYYDAVAEPTVLFRGEETAFNEALDMAESYEEYIGTLMSYYEKYNKKLAEIYIRLVKTREKLAAAMGYDSYEEMQYDYAYDRDYTPEEAEAYMQDIVSYMVPLYRDMSEGGLLDMRERSLSENKLYEILSKTVGLMGGELQETLKFIDEYELYDITLSDKKFDSSFMTYLDSYDCPYLFLNPGGSISDALTLIHEFGHVADGFLNYNFYEKTDTAECFSQGLELISLSYLKDVLKAEELENVTAVKMRDCVGMYVQQASFAEFEHEVYKKGGDNLSVDFLNKLSYDLAVKYGYIEEGFEDYYAMSWIDIPHFFEVPFYVISYPVSHDVAMQLYELELEETGTGLARYMEMIHRDSGTMIETAESGDLVSPFTPGQVEKAADCIRKVCGL